MADQLGQNHQLYSVRCQHEQYVQGLFRLKQRRLLQARSVANQLGPNGQPRANLRRYVRKVQWIIRSFDKD
jgi:hypothetical protein